MTDHLVFHFLPRPWDDCIGIHVAWKRQDGVHMMEPAGFKRVEPGLRSDEPALKITREEAQGLVDALDDLGYRATRESRAEAKAKEDHLRDLRVITFNQLKIKDLP